MERIPFYKELTKHCRRVYVHWCLVALFFPVSYWLALILRC
jgi:hypothetical protein